MLYGHGPREQDREQDKGVRQGVRWEQDRFAASHSHCPHMVVGTLNSSMVVGALKIQYKMLYGGMGQESKTGSKTRVRQGQHREQDRG